MTDRFEEIEHTADVAIRVWGRDLAELFVAAAYGMACQLADPSSITPTEERTISLEACDVETLLVAWLGELLYLDERDDCVLIDFDFREITPTRLQAVGRGGPPRERRGHIKAATFSDLEIHCTAEGCETTVVFDV